MADPKVQLEQAITEAQDQHRRLIEQAANVIANQKQTEMRLNRAMEELEKLNGSARQAVTMADEATTRGDTAKMADYTKAAEAFANRLIATEQEVESLKQLLLQATQAADQAKHAVRQNSMALQKKLADRQKLMGQLDQAKMQEQVNQAMTSLNETVGQDVPTFDEVRDKIEARYAKALGTSELTERVGREPDARGRAGPGEHRGPGPPGRDPQPARAVVRRRTRGRRAERARSRARRRTGPRRPDTPATEPVALPGAGTPGLSPVRRPPRTGGASGRQDAPVSSPVRAVVAVGADHGRPRRGGDGLAPAAGPHRRGRWPARRAARKSSPPMASTTAMPTPARTTSSPSSFSSSVGVAGAEEPLPSRRR